MLVAIAIVIIPWIIFAYVAEKFYRKMFNEGTWDYMRREWFGKANTDTGATGSD